jgi:hypothetical protein
VRNDNKMDKTSRGSGKERKKEGRMDGKGYET